MIIKFGGLLAAGAGVFLLASEGARAEVNYDFTALGNDGLNAFGGLTAAQLSPGTYFVPTGFLDITMPNLLGSYSLMPNPNPGEPVTGIEGFQGDSEFKSDDLSFIGQVVPFDVNRQILSRNAVTRDLSVSADEPAGPTVKLFEFGSGNEPYGAIDRAISENAEAGAGGGFSPLSVRTPDAGNTLALLSLGLTGLAVFRRKRV